MTFEEAYRAHFAFVWRSLRRLGIREEDAADAAQEVFIVVHRKLPEFAGNSKLTTWLYGICFRVASERRRAHPLPPAERAGSGGVRRASRGIPARRRSGTRGSRCWSASSIASPTSSAPSSACSSWKG